VSPDGRFYWDGQRWVPIQAPVAPEPPLPGQLSPDRKYYWDGERWVPEALAVEEGIVTRVPVPTTPPQVSPDGRFYWDSHRWVPVQAPVAPEPPLPGQLSPDGKYYWDGERWLGPATLAAQAGIVTIVLVPTPPQVSPDGRFYWDGQRWVPMPTPTAPEPPSVAQPTPQLSPVERPHLHGPQTAEQALGEDR
jgi:hypothetical protein